MDSTSDHAQELIRLDWRRFIVVEAGKSSEMRRILQRVKLFYSQIPPQESKTTHFPYEIVFKTEISIPGHISDPIGSLYNALTKKIINLILEHKATGVLFVYSHFEPQLSFEKSNPSGLVELFFNCFFLIPKTET